jgi:hypothetical protein
MLCDVVWCCVVLCDVVWCCVVLCGVVWCCVVLCGVVWCCVVLWCCVVSCGVVWCRVVPCGVVWCGVICGEMCVVFGVSVMTCRRVSKMAHKPFNPERGTKDNGVTICIIAHNNTTRNSVRGTAMMIRNEEKENSKKGEKGK